MSVTDFNIDLLKEEYLLRIDEDLNALESKIIELEKVQPSDLKSSIYEIFRTVHSIKGSAGSFDLYILSNIFHRFEDHVDTDVDQKNIAGKIDLFCHFIDLGRKCLADYINERTHELEKYSTLVDNIAFSADQKIGKMLLVDPGKSIQKIFQKLCDEHSIELSILRNGATAMNRILSERFDSIVSSVNIDVLDGKSLLMAIRVMENVNKESNLLLISSDESTVIQDQSILCIQKNSDLILNIDRYIKTELFKIEMKPVEQVFPFKNVFISEDDQMIQLIISKILSSKDDVEFEIFGNLSDIESQISVSLPDLIVLDYFLKDCTALKVMEFISKDSRLEKVPIIIMTSSPDKIDIEGLRKLGNVKGIVEKPIKARTFLKEITQIALN